MITERFNSRTMANLEVALERACLLLSTDREKHLARRVIAAKLIECANRGDVTLSGLTAAGSSVAMQMSAAKPRRAAARLGKSLRAS